MFRTAVPNFIFDYTRVPFRFYSVCFVTFKGSGTWVLGSKMSFLPLQSIPHVAVLVLLSLAADAAGPPTWMRSQCSVARQARPRAGALGAALAHAAAPHVLHTTAVKLRLRTCYTLLLSTCTVNKLGPCLLSPKIQKLFKIPVTSNL